MATTKNSKVKARGHNRRYGQAGRHNDIPDLRLRPYRRWWVQALLVTFRWRTELVAIVATMSLWAWLNGPLGNEGAAIAMVPVVAVVFAVPHTRRVAWPRVMCVVTRHRIRSCLSQLAASNRDGRLPWIVWIRPTPVGERAWLWMIAGLSVNDVKDRTEALAAACWARETRVERSRTRAMVVRVDIIRRDPLSAPKPIENPLMDGTRHVRAVEPGKVIELMTARRAVTAPATKVTSEGTKPSTSTQTATKPVESAIPVEPERPRIVTRHGEDVSDYV